jgi:hypothetical protein
MATVTTPLEDRARSIFSDMGYDIDGRETGFRADRKWRSVSVRVVDPEADLPSDGGLRCFVIDRDDADALRDRLADERPDYDWAVMGVDDTGYEVLRGAGWV